MRIRKAIANDVAGIRRLLDEQNTFNTELQPTVFRRSSVPSLRVESIFDDEASQMWVAECQGRLVGFIEFPIRETKNLPVLVPRTYVYIQELIVSEAWQSRGVGTELMEAARSWTRDHGIRSLRTSVVPHNESALAFYRRQGFDDLYGNHRSLPIRHPCRGMSDAGHPRPRTDEALLSSTVSQAKKLPCV